MKASIKCISSYNKMFFKEKSRSIYDVRNNDFWQNLDALHQQNRDHQITVETYLSKRLPVSYYFEDVKIYCDQPSTLEQSMKIYRDHYHIVPLELYEDSEEINDELKAYLLYD